MSSPEKREKQKSEATALLDQVGPNRCPQINLHTYQSAGAIAPKTSVSGNGGRFSPDYLIAGSQNHVTKLVSYNSLMNYIDNSDDLLKNHVDAETRRATAKEDNLQTQIANEHAGRVQEIAGVRTLLINHINDPIHHTHSDEDNGGGSGGGGPSGGGGGGSIELPLQINQGGTGYDTDSNKVQMLSSLMPPEERLPNALLQWGDSKVSWTPPNVWVKRYTEFGPGPGISNTTIPAGGDNVYVNEALRLVSGRLYLHVTHTINAGDSDSGTSNRLARLGPNVPIPRNDETSNPIYLFSAVNLVVLTNDNLSYPRSAMIMNRSILLKNNKLDPGDEVAISFTYNY